MIPMDDGLIDGPEGGLRCQQDKLKEIVNANPNGILGFRGLLINCWKQLNNIPVIINLTASTSLVTHTRKVLVGHVEDAIRLGADGVAVHVNISSKYESEMLKILGKISSECEKMGIPLLALMYPRSENFDGSDNNFIELKKKSIKKYVQLVRHAARIGSELGADIIKTQFTGNIETFSTVVESCGGSHVVIAGGPKVKTEQILQDTYESIQAGASGVCIGRNAFNRENTSKFIKSLNMIVHNNNTVEDALLYLSTSKEK